MQFRDLEIAPKCLSLLEKEGIDTPTEIQDKAIPAALEGRDVIGVAQTGTGKTLAFGLPALTRISADKRRGKGTQMLILTPTRELAQQNAKVIEPLAKAVGLRSFCVFGGVGMSPQTRALRSGVDIVIATPGRLLDHIRQGNVRFKNLKTLVLDEADRMLDMGFLPDIRSILRELPDQRQTMMFSATFPSEIARLAKDFQRDPHRVDISPKAIAAEAVRQNVYTVDSARKTELLGDILDKDGVDSAIVFSRTKRGTDRIAKRLEKKGFKVQAIHGGRSQNQRDRALNGFRRGRFQVLVATDVAARGLDVRGVTHVVNYDVPKCFDDYVHRIGRTGRAEETGDAITFVCPQDFKELALIEKGLGKALPREEWDGAVPVVSLFSDAPKKSRKRKLHHFKSKQRFARAR